MLNVTLYTPSNHETILLLRRLISFKLINSKQVEKRSIIAFSSYEKVLVLYVKNDFWNFYQIFTFWEPLNEKKRFLQKWLSVVVVVGRRLDNSR